MAPHGREGTCRSGWPNGHVTQLWGMTETQAGLYTRPGDPIETVAGSAGRPSPGTEVRVVGPDDAELAAGDEGELHVRGPLLFPGLLQPPGSEPRGVLRRRLVPHRRPRGRRPRRKRRDHRPMQGRDQPGRRQVQPPRHRGPARRPSAGRHGRDRSGPDLRNPVLGERACCCITVAGDPAPTLEDSARTWTRTASRRRDGRNVWRSSTRCR